MNMNTTVFTQDTDQAFSPRPLSDANVRHLRHCLLRERDELAIALWECEQVLSDDTVIELSEATSREEFEAIHRAHQESINAVDVAIGRMNAGTYGRCAQCDTAIPFERLEAIASAATCVDCQSSPLEMLRTVP